MGVYKCSIAQYSYSVTFSASLRRIGLYITTWTLACPNRALSVSRASHRYGRRVVSLCLLQHESVATGFSLARSPPLFGILRKTAFLIWSMRGIVCITNKVAFSGLRPPGNCLLCKWSLLRKWSLPRPFFCAKNPDTAPKMVGRVPNVFTIEFTNSSIFVSPSIAPFKKSESTAVDASCWSRFWSWA